MTTTTTTKTEKKMNFKQELLDLTKAIHRLEKAKGYKVFDENAADMIEAALDNAKEQLIEALTAIDQELVEDYLDS